MEILGSDDASNHFATRQAASAATIDLDIEEDED